MAGYIRFGRSLSSLKKISLSLYSTSRLSSYWARSGHRDSLLINISNFKKSKLPFPHSRTSCIPALSRSFCSENNPKESMLDDLKSSPPPAIWLGLSGAIPFCGLAGLSLITPEYLDTIIHAQCTYGACILTFLGAVHWGYAIAKDSPLKPNWGTLGYSVTPSLVAWSALLIKPQYGLVTIAIGLLYALSKDLATPYFPGWYHALRKLLTTLAASSVILTATAFYLH